MPKVIRYLNEAQKEFQRVFSEMCERKSAWQVWADFIDCAAISISCAVDRENPKRKQREDRYAEIMKSYQENERQRFGELFAVMLNALELNPNQDFLGEMFMALELGSHWHGQFFTPYNVCKMMAVMQIGGAEESVERRGWVGVCDPTCGAGALLIAARNEFSAKGIGYRRVLFIAQDIDHVAGLMCYIQLSLLGCAGYVVIANTLTNPATSVDGGLLLPIIKEDQDYWFMPMIFDEVWCERIVWARADFTVRMMAGRPAGAVATPNTVEEKTSPYVDMVEDVSPIETKETPAAHLSDGSGQLSFF